MAWNMTPLPVLTPERLEQQLEELDITNEEAAYYAGVSVATLYRWLKGTTPIPASVIRMFDLKLAADAAHSVVKVVWGMPPGEDAIEEATDADAG